MKRNLFLFSLLVVLLFITYVFEELGHIQKKQKEDDATRVLDFKDLGNLKSFKTANLELVSKNGHFETINPSYLADRVKTDSLFSILSEIKVRRVLSVEESSKLREEDFFPHKNLWFHFTLEKGEVEVVLGKKLAVDTTFYIKMKRSDQAQAFWAIAYDNSSIEGVYSQEEDQTNLGKYQRLTTLLLLKSDFFWDGHLIKENLGIKKLAITNTRNRSFEVEFDEKKTSPSILPGLSFSEEGATQYLKGLRNLQSKKIFLEPGKQKLEEPLAKIVITTKEKKELNIQLFKRFGKQTGYFIKSSEEPTVFEMGQELSQFFYANVQDFWQKTLIEFFSPQFFLYKDGQKFGIRRSEDGHFYSDRNMNVNEMNLNRLYLLLTRPADRLEEVEIKEVPPQHALEIEFDKYTIYFYELGTELIAFVPSLKIKFHYFMGEMPISFKLMDYFR